MKNKKIIIIGAVIVIAVVIALCLMFGVFGSKEGKVNKEMTRLVTEYYEQNIKGKVIGVNQQKVTLKALEDAGFDISKIKNPETGEEYDKTTAYSLVIIEDPNETNKDAIKYTIENHLDGK